MYTRRLIVFLVTCLLTVVAIAWLRPTARDGIIPSDAFWSAKTHDGEATYDVVVAGDSRVLAGVNPIAMREHLPGSAILNFGYLGAGLTPEFVAAASRKLDPSSSARILVLGVTPLSLVSRSLTNKHFKQETSKPAIGGKHALDLEPLRRVFEPFHPFAEPENSPPPGFEPFRAGGWMASDGSADSEIALRSYRWLFEQSTFDEANFARLIAALAEANANGVRLFAFRHPSSLAMEALEDRLSGFREADVKSRLEAAGVTWLSFPADNGRELAFTTADASHLEPKGAVAFSAALAKEIASHL